MASMHDDGVVASAAWFHRLRNELSTAQMACAAARAMLLHGQLASVDENLARAISACERAANLLPPGNIGPAAQDRR